MTSAPAFIRALSPAVQGIAAAIYETTDPGNVIDGVVNPNRARNARHSAIMGAGAVHEIIELIPHDYRGPLADHLRGLAQLTTKLHNSRATLANWRTMKQAGTLPSGLKSTPPQVQLTSNFAGSEAARASKDALDLAHAEYQQATFSAWIQAKGDEVTALEGELAPERVWKVLRTQVLAASEPIIGRSKLPELSTDPDTGNQEITAWEPCPAVIALRDHMLEDCGAYANRVVLVTEAGLATDAIRIKKKRDLAAAAKVAAGEVDVEMGDETTAQSSKSIKALISKEVASALAKHAPPKASSSSGKRKAEQGPGSSGGDAEKRRKMA